MRKILMPVALVLALCCTTFAGEMHTPPVAGPTNAAQEPTADGETPNNVTDALKQFALSVLVSVLS